MYKVVFDNGKPYEEEFKTDEELKAGLKSFYVNSQENGEGYYMDAQVFNDKGEDISESQFIAEMIGEIIDIE